MATRAAEIEDRRQPLSRDRVLRAAIDLADAGGIEALSMRRLAQELGVEAMSLYYHVANKNDILDGIVDMVVGEFELPPPDAEWKAAIRTAAMSAYDVLVRHPWAASLVLSGPGVSTARLRYMDAILGTLRRAGLSAEMTDHAYHALDSHIVGFTLWVLPYLALARERPDYADEFMAQQSLDELPHLVEHIGVHLAERHGDTNEFDFGLDLILDGLERLRDGS